MYWGHPWESGSCLLPSPRRLNTPVQYSKDISTIPIHHASVSGLGCVQRYASMHENYPRPVDPEHAQQGPPPLAWSSHPCL